MKIFEITPQDLLILSKISTALNCCLPPSPNARKTKVLIFDVLCGLTFISSILLLIPLLCSVYQDRDDSVIMVKSIYLSCAMAHAANKIAVCRFYRQGLQVVLCEIVHFLEYATKKEKKVLQHFVNKYGILYIFFILANYLGATTVIMGPIFMPTPFPTEAKYPFPVDWKPLKYIIYVHQSISGYQVSAAMSLDCLVGFFLWFVAAKFEILSEKFRNVKSETELILCIREHQELLSRYANEVIKVVRFLILTTLSTATSAMIFCGIQLFTAESLAVKVQSTVIVCAGCGLLFVSAWPAEILIQKTEKISMEVFNSDWIGKSPKVLKIWIFTLQRTQRPIILKIGGILPKLCLSYYSQYLSDALKYLAAIRVIVNKG